jgi:hypothetical protein
MRRLKAKGYLRTRRMGRSNIYSAAVRPASVVRDLVTGTGGRVILVADFERIELARFGDVALVKRQCWWIHNGEEFMFRTVGIALLSLLTIGVAVVGFGG